MKNVIPDQPTRSDKGCQSSRRASPSSWTLADFLKSLPSFNYPRLFSPLRIEFLSLSFLLAIYAATSINRNGFAPLSETET